MAESNIAKENKVGRCPIKGVPIEIKDAVHKVTVAGIVKDVKTTWENEEELIKDESGANCGYSARNTTLKMDFTVMSEEASVLPRAGMTIDHASLSPLGVTDQGTVVVNSGSSRNYSNEGVSEITFSATWHPFMEDSSTGV